MNIPDTLNTMLAIYANAAFTLMKEFPKAHGINFIIREDGDYAAIPTADVPPGYAAGYGNKKFEARAAKLLKELVTATEAIRDGCSVTDSVEKLGISVKKVNGTGEVRLRATVSSRHGYLFCYRDAHFRTDKPIFFAASPAVMCLTVTAEGEGHSDVIRTTAEKGMEALFESVARNNLMLDLKSDPTAWKAMTENWKSAFPTEGEVQLDPMAHLFQCYVVGNQDKPLAILSENAAENAGVTDMPDVDVMHFDALLTELSKKPLSPCF
jgi:hypothetical protein